MYICILYHVFVSRIGKRLTPPPRTTTHGLPKGGTPVFATMDTNGIPCRIAATNAATPKDEGRLKASLASVANVTPSEWVCLWCIFMHRHDNQ